MTILQPSTHQGICHVAWPPSANSAGTGPGPVACLIARALCDAALQQAISSYFSKQAALCSTHCRVFQAPPASLSCCCCGAQCTLATFKVVIGPGILDQLRGQTSEADTQVAAGLLAGGHSHERSHYHLAAFDKSRDLLCLATSICEFGQQRSWPIQSHA